LSCVCASNPTNSQVWKSENDVHSFAKYFIDQFFHLHTSVWFVTLQADNQTGKKFRTEKWMWFCSSDKRLRWFLTVVDESELQKQKKTNHWSFFHIQFLSPLVIVQTNILIQGCEKYVNRKKNRSRLKQVSSNFLLKAFVTHIITGIARLFGLRA
jgi:hypothetical protein